VADSDTENSLVVDEVWLDGQIAYRNVSRFILMLDGEHPSELDGHEIRIKAKGYWEWTTRIRIRTRKERQIFLPIHLLKVKPQSSIAVIPLDDPEDEQQEEAEHEYRDQRQQCQQEPVSIRQTEHPSRWGRLSPPDESVMPGQAHVL